MSVSALARAARSPAPVPHANLSLPPSLEPGAKGNGVKPDLFLVSAACFVVGIIILL